ncbi:MAG: co-chaperone YbbN [Pseudomonadota bacterium]
MAMIIGEGGGQAPDGPAAGPAGDVIKDATTETFQADVLEASMQQPVIVDLWAPWCEPCKQLQPALEKVVAKAGGKVRLVKVNIDEEQQIAQALRVQSIPAVFAFDKGQPIDGFVGAQSESQIKAFVERLIGPVGPSPVDQALEQAQAALEAEDFAQAAAVFQQVMQHEPGNIDALAGLGRAMIGLGNVDDVREMIDGLDEPTRADDRIHGLIAQLDLLSEGAADLAPLNARIAADENDHEARFELAKALAAMNKRDEAVDALIGIIERKRDWNDEAARKELIKFFEAFGPTDPATVEGRKKLSAAWFS